MPAQTSYAKQMTIGHPGLTYEMARTTNDSAVNFEATAELPFGVFVARAATPDVLLRPRVVQLSTATDPIHGAVLHSHAYNRETDLGTVGIKPGVLMDIRVAGALWMMCEQDIVLTDSVFARFASGAGGTIRGILRKDADTNTARSVKGARFITPSYNVNLFGQPYKIAVVEFDTLLTTLP